MSAPATVYASGPGHAIWFAPGVFGTSFWGPHERGSHATFFAHVDAAMAQLAPPFDYIADTQRTRLGDHDWDSVTLGFAWMRARRAFLESVTRQAIILAPNDVFGWAVAGSQRLVGMRYPTRVASSIPDAVTYLVDHPDRAGLAAWLEALPDRIRAGSSEITRLRALLAADPATTLEAVAGALGLGGRNLQRVLEAHGTSFRREQQHARSARRGAAEARAEGDG